jgi:hypothetical protein
VPNNDARHATAVDAALHRESPVVDLSAAAAARAAAATVQLPGGGGKPIVPAMWTEAVLRKNIQNCPAAKLVWNQVMLANLAGDSPLPTEPVIMPTDPETGVGVGRVKTGNAVIQVSTTLSPCRATEVLVFESLNLIRKREADDIRKRARAGDLSRHDFIWSIEKIEFENVRKVLVVFDACRNAWGCGETSQHEVFRQADTFEKYKETLLRTFPAHPEGYGKEWDTFYKAAYDAKHPAAPAQPGQPAQPQPPR